MAFASHAIARAPAAQPDHHMVTRSKHGIVKPVEHLNLSATHEVLTPVPSSYKVALIDPSWRQVMTDEYQALVDNGTWTLVPRPHGANIVFGK